MPNLKYVDCTVTVRNESETEYKDPYKPPIIGHIRDDQNGDALIRATIEQLNDWVARPENPFTKLDLQLLGRHLFYFLFDDELCDAFKNTYQGFKKTADENTRLRLILAFHKEAARLASYPWEFLYMPDRSGESGFFLSAEKRTELILTRFVPEPAAAELYPEETDLKILVAFSNPKELGGKLVADEFLHRIQAMKQAQVRVVQNRTADELAEAVRDFPPHIFHFIGHGDSNRGVALIRNPEEVQEQYDLTGETCDADWRDSKGLADVFTKFDRNSPRLIFLHACEGAASDSLKSFSNTAWDLVYSHGIPAVVAMQYVITNEAASLFAETFYAQLAEGKTIDVAVTEGRFALGHTMRGEWGDRVFGTPIVYLQSDTAIVLRKETEAKKQPCPYIRLGTCTGGFVFPGDRIHPLCRQPLAKCERGHVIAPGNLCQCGAEPAPERAPISVEVGGPGEPPSSRADSGYRRDDAAVSRRGVAADLTARAAYPEPGEDSLATGDAAYRRPEGTHEASDDAT